MRKATMIIVALLLTCQSIPALARDDEKATLAMPASKAHHWYVVVCSSRADEVVLQAGGSEDDNAVFAKWHQRDGQKRFPLPSGIQARTKVYVRMSIPDGKFQTEACVGYDGYAKKAFRFDNKNQNNKVSMDDNDSSCACR